jgi:hypothetical protein
MNKCKIYLGWLPFRRGVEFNFNLAALKVATATCRLDLGEFYTSEKLNDDHRFFYHTFGAWLNGRDYSPKLFAKYQKIYKRLNVSHIHKLKQTIIAANILSSELMKAMKRSQAEKKN